MINPYETPRNENTRASQAGKPNTWLVNWSLFLFLLFFLLDGPFLLHIWFRDSPWRYLSVSFLVDGICLSPIIVLLYVDGFRGLRAALWRAFGIAVFLLLHIGFVSAST